MSKKYPFKYDPLAWTGISGLQRTVLLFVVLPLLLLTALGIRFGLEQASQFQQQRLKDDLELIGRAISIPIGNALREGDQQAIEAALSSVFIIGEVYGASVFDVNGVRLSAAGTTESDLSRTAIPDLIVSTGQAQQGFSRVDGRNLFSHFMPLFDAGGNIQGLIQISRRASDFGRALDQLEIIAWLAWAVLAIGIICAVMLGHYGGVGRHVDRLLEHMQHVAAGNHAHRAALEGPTEVASLARGLNQMLDSIEQAQQELDQHRLAETRLLAQLKDQEKMAAIGGMARGVAHELGAPLSVIDGRARRLQRNSDTSAAQTRELNAIRAQVARLTRTVRQLLDYSRPSAVQPRTTSLRQILDSATAAITPELDDAGRQLEVVPLASAHLPNITVDPARLELALLNLLRNALQASRSCLRVTVSQQQDYLRIDIEDDGPGLPEATHAQLLEPFFTTKPPGEGTGLGLAIVDTIAEEHDGELQLGSSDLGGCRATLLLPTNRESTA
ncbi:two-component sensor histidine kinase [Halopseudomonas oceani]|uniref:histidine kinase n=1 Tax=Halopseudomonas oceani TaxID=1708783 RepID=A0A2P4EWE6_9GAMM|nr:HAMP domain-containing sensor histidine kinase [Halopseudomonas oceani]POB04301.1 sensor histidine kinase [Halopseudomonas oceani]GGE31249.1 two-component sensor histidine kinase [Halopseudomonas oceani]